MLDVFFEAVVLKFYFHLLKVFFIELEKTEIHIWAPSFEWDYTVLSRYKKSPRKITTLKNPCSDIGHCMNATATTREKAERSALRFGEVTNYRAWGIFTNFDSVGRCARLEVSFIYVIFFTKISHFFVASPNSLKCFVCRYLGRAHYKRSSVCGPKQPQSRRFESGFGHAPHGHQCRANNSVNLVLYFVVIPLSACVLFWAK